jgi:RNA recognition motif-containing protein
MSHKSYYLIEVEEEETTPATTGAKEEAEPINRILYIQNLPPDVTDEMLSYLFQQYVHLKSFILYFNWVDKNFFFSRYPGFKEVRLVPGKSDIAFVEYEADHQAAVAKDVLNKFKITHDKEMKVTFAKR